MTFQVSLPGACDSPPGLGLAGGSRANSGAYSEQAQKQARASSGGGGFGASLREGSAAGSLQ